MWKLWLILMASNGIIPSGGQYSQRQTPGGVGGVNIYSDPIGTNPWDQGFYDPNKGWLNASGGQQTTDPTKFNPYTMGYVSGGKWNPYQKYLPDKIIPSQLTQTPEQTVGAAQFFMGGQSATQGQPQPQTPFQTSSATQSTQDVQNPNSFSGFMFGNNGSAGKMAGQFGNTIAGQQTPFYQQQQSSTTQSGNPLLGTLQPWSPNLSALRQSR